MCYRTVAPNSRPFDDVIFCSSGDVLECCLVVANVIGRVLDVNIDCDCNLYATLIIVIGKYGEDRCLVVHIGILLEQFVKP
jgi:hypothetical protein